jgi:hypothetical protein
MLPFIIDKVPVNTRIVLGATSRCLCVTSPAYPVALGPVLHAELQLLLSALFLPSTSCEVQKRRTPLTSAA